MRTLFIYYFYMREGEYEFFNCFYDEINRRYEKIWLIDLNFITNSERYFISSVNILSDNFLFENKRN